MSFEPVPETSKEPGAKIELFLGNIKGNAVWAPGELVSYNKDSDTYNVLCDGFGEVRGTQSNYRWPAHTLCSKVSAIPSLTCNTG